MLALTLLLGASACSSDDNADPPDTTVAPSAAPTSTTAATTTTTTEPKSEEDQVADAYLEAEMLYFEIGTQPDPDDPRLTTMYGEPNLTFLRKRIEQLRKDGIFARYPNDALPIPEVLDVSMDGQSAQLVSCVVDNAQQVRRSDGKIINDDVVSKKYDVVLTMTSGVWKVVDGELIEKWSDGNGCDR